jgi:glucose-1-phosphate cytidylyltransferase
VKAIILAGGLGTRLSEETLIKPKPMVEIGGKPILWHIMKNYSAHGINDFVICLGYKGYLIKEYFANYFLHMSDVTIDISQNSISFLGSPSEQWKITLVETGDISLTGERLKRVKRYVEDDQDFCFTYGDGVSNINITESISFHREQNKVTTLAAVSPKSRYGAITLSENFIENFSEKPENMEGLVNGGFFVVNAKVFDYLDSENVSWEGTVLPRLAEERQLVAYRHEGFWQSMDTLRDKEYLQSLWDTGKAPWKNWLD